MNKEFGTNQVRLVGKVMEKPVYSHEVYGEGFYLTRVKVIRKSEAADEIPVMMSERMCNVSELQIGDRLRITGQFRSFNRHEEEKNYLVLSVFVREIEFLDDMQQDLEENEIVLDGYICKKPIYRKTPLDREITDLMVAVSRSYGKSDYIPCICWGRNARFASNLEIGNRVKLCGRIQSREYNKKISETEVEKRVAYEASISKIEHLED